MTIRQPLLEHEDALKTGSDECQKGPPTSVTWNLEKGANSDSQESLDDDMDDCPGPLRQETIRTQIKKVTKNDRLGTSHAISSPFQHRPQLRQRNDTSETVQKRLRERVMLSCLIMFTEGFYATQIFPYGAWMVEELRGTSHGVGLYTGLLSTAQSSGMLVTAYLWASFSNRHGRKPCLLTGLTANVVFTVLQAFSRDYWMVAVVRFLSGVLNSNLSIMRTALREAFQHERSEDTWAFSTLSVAFSASCMAGPSLGGLMYGKVVPILEGAQNPWSASMLTCTCMYVVCIVFTWWRLPETAFLASQRRPKASKDSCERPSFSGSQGRPLSRDVNFLLIIVMGGGHSYVFTGWEILYPVFARLPFDQLGEQWTAAKIGITFLIGSLGLCVYSLTCYPRIAKRLSIIRLWCISWVVPLLVMPAFPRLITTVCATGVCASASGRLVNVMNYVAQICISILLGSGFITVQVILNNYVGARPDGKSALAVANSMLVSMQALVRAISPVVTGSLFVYGLEEEHAPGRWTLTRSLPFDSLALIGLFSCLLCGLAFESRMAEADSAS